MALADTVLARNNDLPIRVQSPVHSGKVRSVYWLTPEDSQRLIETKGYNVAPNTPLAVMVISDRISAFECIWHGEGGLAGVPGKGAALNAIAHHWFQCFKQAGLADSHILDVPHPLVWIVQQARPVMIEAIGRQYIAGSMWRAYAKGERTICGIELPDGLEQNQKLESILLTPSTKGVMQGVPGIPEMDDVNISRDDILNNLAAFKFQKADDVTRYETFLTEGFQVIAQELSKIDQLLVDTKFEFGYVTDAKGEEQLIYMDEVGTPDSSRIWDAKAYEDGKVIENSKEGFRQALLNYFPDSDILVNKDRMAERAPLAENNALPESMIMDVATTYRTMAEAITGQALPTMDQPRQAIVDVLNDYGLMID